MEHITLLQKNGYISILNKEDCTIGRLQQRPLETPESSKEWLFLALTARSITVEELEDICKVMREKETK